MRICGPPLRRRGSWLELYHPAAIITDAAFNVNVKAPAFYRNVEVYQWVEDSETKYDTTTYTYF